MNKKTVLTFSLGFITSAVLFGVVCLAQRSTLHGSAAVVHPEIVLPLPSSSKTLPQTAPVPARESIKATPQLEQVAQVQAVEIPQAKETAAFKSFISSTLDAHSVAHEVKAGDTLTGISKKTHVTADLIRRINHIEGDKLILGSKLKIPTVKLSVVVDKSQNSLILKGDEEVFKTYVVSTGANNSTPVGVFKITNKLINPTWYKSDGKVIPYGDPANLLGTRWMGLTKKGYGIHGTLEPEKLGQQITDGCIRMKNEEVEELYGFLTPGTEVTIVD